MAKTQFDLAKHIEEVEKTTNALPLVPPAHTVETLINHGIGGKDILIYRAGRYSYPGEVCKRSAVRVTCTACHSSWIAEKVTKKDCRQSWISHISFRPLDDVVEIHDQDNFTCQNCGRTLRVVHVSHFGGRKTYGLDGTWCMTVHNVRGHLCVLQWVVEKLTDKDGSTFYKYHKKNGTLIVDGRCITVKGYTSVFFGTVNDSPVWLRRTNYVDEYAPYNASEIIPFDPSEIWTSDSPHCAFEDYIRQPVETSFFPTAYLRLWTRFPNVENLVRSGHAILVNKIIAACREGKYGYYAAVKSTFNTNKTRDYIDWKKVRPHEMIGVEKAEMSGIDDRDVEEIAVSHLCKKHHVKSTKTFIKKVKKLGIGDIKSLINKKWGDFQPKFERTVNYLSKQKKDTGFLRDYWNMTLQVYGSIPKELAYPADLKLAHDEMILRQKEKTNAELDREIKAQAKKKASLCFADPETGLEIHPCRSHEEIIKEGKLLHHCVGSYAQSVAKGRTTILFIRRSSQPDIPFFTLEYNNGKVIQNRGEHNCDRTDDVKKFEAKWLKYITEDKKKNGKRNNDRTEGVGTGAA